MSALEQEIVEKFQQLDTSAKQRVLAHLERAVQSSFNYANWWAEVEALQNELRARLGEQATIGALSLLDDLREEAS
jgi:hypothetical protein